ncbi:MAG: T9SS type A sorting domain-containing protein, partial [Candidatus Cloacimonadaceae bacterium]|nr:T9SS type A sorting domain-containing protein [Candidatus Cloacimonadaceae bacterium]
YPNPFNPSTNIVFDIYKDEDVRVEIFNLRGQKVSLLAQEHMARGKHQVVWNGTDDNGSNVGSGMYIIRLATTTDTKTAKVLLMK